jgi:hypothetical protein
LTSLLAVPAHTSPGFLTILWVSRALFQDPEWSLQLLPFICGIAAIPVVALMVRRLTHSDGLGILAAALTALNPMLAHYTVFVKEYTLGFLATACVLWAAASRFEDSEPHTKQFFRTSLAAGVLVFFSITSVFASMPVINLVALRSLRQKRESARSVIISAAIYDLLVLAAFHTMRNRTNEVVAADFQDMAARRGLLGFADRRPRFGWAVHRPGEAVVRPRGGRLLRGFSSRQRTACVSDGNGAP